MFSGINRPISIKLGRNHPWVIVKIKDQASFGWEIITKKLRIGWGHLKVYTSQDPMTQKSSYLHVSFLV
jgi:hypothetical protein